VVLRAESSRNLPSCRETWASMKKVGLKTALHLSAWLFEP